MKVSETITSLICFGIWIGGIDAALAQTTTAPTRGQPPAPDLLLYPSRVVLEGNTRAAQVGLVNNLDVTATYRIHFVNRRMTSSGQLVAVTEAGPGENFAADLLRYSPRQVVLPPGSSQIVRIMVRKPGDLPEGEYRSHLMFERVPDATLPDPAQPTLDKGIAIQLTPLVSVTIPVIVRHGKTVAQAGLTGLSFSPGKSGAPPQLGFHITRSGNASLFGDLEVTLVALGRSYPAGQARGVAVYVPNSVRKTLLELTVPQGVPLAGSELQLVYRARPEEGGAVFARATLPLR